MPDAAHTSPEGWVYLIVNDGQDPRLVKIGKTDRDPIERARELVSTGTVGTFVVIYQAWVRSPPAVEKRVHQILARHRKQGEWFDVCPNVAKQEIHSAAGTVLYEKMTPRWHPSQPEPAAWTKVFLEEARLAAEAAERAARLEAERAARLEAERRRVEKAQRAEADRLAAEIAERQRREEEIAKAAALQAEAEQRKRQQEAEEAKRQRAKETFSRLMAVGALLVGVISFVVLMNYARDRFARPALAVKTKRAPAALAAPSMAGAQASSPLPMDSSVVRHQRLVEHAELRVASLRTEVDAKRQAVERAEAEVVRLPDLKRQRLRDLASAQSALEVAKKRLADKEERLRRLALEEPRDLERSGELFRGEGDVGTLQREVADAQQLAIASDLACRFFPDAEQQARDRLWRAKNAAGEAEQRLAEHVQALEAAKRELAEAVRRSQR